MVEPQSFDETTLARQWLGRLSEENGVVYGAIRLLDCIADGSAALGEVLQDYARQSSGQLRAAMEAARRGAQGPLTAEDGETLRGIPAILKSARTVLDMTPPAMLRNKAETIGDKKKITRAELLLRIEAFTLNPDIAPLLASEDEGCEWVEGLPIAAPKPHVPAFGEEGEGMRE